MYIFLKAQVWIVHVHTDTTVVEELKLNEGQIIT